MRGPSAITKSFGGFTWRITSKTLCVVSGRLKIIKVTGVFILIFSELVGQKRTFFRKTISAYKNVFIEARFR
jgi:hypothetical protein